MTQADIKRVLDKLCSGWDRKAMSEAQVELWTEDLAALDFGPAYAAARQFAREAERFPKVAEFVAVYHTHRRRQTDESTRKDCPFCEGGWVIVHAATIPTVKPCLRCDRAGSVPIPSTQL